MAFTVKINKANIEAYILANTMDQAAQRLEQGYAYVYQSLENIPYDREGMKLYKLSGTLEIVE